MKFHLLAATLAVACTSVSAQQTFDGYLCCNLRSDGRWISDINYAEGGKRVIAVGVPTKITGYGRYRVHVELQGLNQAIGNDYSRDLSMEEFARRYVVTEDPKKKIEGYPENIRHAILSARLVPGMTREQVIMAVGYPVSSENPHLDAKSWRFWLSSFDEFRVTFDAQGRVADILTTPASRPVIVYE